MTHRQFGCLLDSNFLKQQKGDYMKTLLIALLLGLGLSTTALAEGHHHSETVCSTTNEQLCLHLGIHDSLKAGQNNRFMVHFMLDETVNPSLINNLSVTALNNNNKSISIQTEQMDEVHFIAKNANFTEAGEWKVEINFLYDNTEHKILVPVTVE